MHGGKQVASQPARIGSLFHQLDCWGATQALKELVGLQRQQLAEHIPQGDRGKKITRPARPGCPGRVKSVLRMVKRLVHEIIKGQGALLTDLLDKLFWQSGIQSYRYLITDFAKGRD